MGNVGLLHDVYGAFARGEMATVLGAFDPQIEWRQAEGNPYEPGGKAWIGPEAVEQKLFMRIGTEWDGFSVEPRIFHDAGPTVVVEGRYAGRYKSTGKALDAQFCHVWRIRDGKVTGFQQFVDTAQLQEVMRKR
jgi:uncharacterized protein